MKIFYGPCDKAYRDHWLRAEGFGDSLEYDWSKAKLTDKQRETVEKLSGGDWLIAIDDDGNVTLTIADKEAFKEMMTLYPLRR